LASLREHAEACAPNGDTDEVVQRAFIEFWQARSSGQPGLPPPTDLAGIEAYLITAVRHRASNEGARQLSHARHGFTYLALARKRREASDGAATDRAEDEKTLLDQAKQELPP